MRVAEIITEAPVPAISLQQAHDGQMFGPIYHGTGADLKQIIQTGFDMQRSVPSTINYMNMPVGTSNGYSLDSYGYTGIAAPIHHLGFGTYFTTVRSIAKQFAGGTMKGMKTFFLDSRNVEEINFGAPNTMMRWWRQNGYNMTAEATKARDTKAWIAATMNLTKNLASRSDAVWFKGKGLRKLLDGDQLCVYRPDLIRVVDPGLSTGLQIGAKVTHTGVVPEYWMPKGANDRYVDEPRPDDFGQAGKLAGKGWRGIYRADDEPRPHGRYPIHWMPPAGTPGIITGINPAREIAGRHFAAGYQVRWSPGGEMYNYAEEELQPFTGRGRAS